MGVYVTDYEEAKSPIEIEGLIIHDERELKYLNSSVAKGINTKILNRLRILYPDLEDSDLQRKIDNYDGSGVIK